MADECPEMNSAPAAQRAVSTPTMGSCTTARDKVLFARESRLSPWEHVSAERAEREALRLRTVRSCDPWHAAKAERWTARTGDPMTGSDEDRT